MDSLVGYGSDDDNETERYSNHRSSGSAGVHGASRRRDDGDNYDAVNMDLSEEESEPELPQAEPTSDVRRSREKSQHHHTDDNRSRDRGRDRDTDRERDRDRDRHKSRDKDRRSPLRDDRHRSDRRSPRRSPRRQPAAREQRTGRPPPLMDVRPFADHDARDAVSPRFVDRRDRDRSERDRSDRDRERDRDRHGRRSEEKRSGGSSRYPEDRTKSRDRDTRTNYPPPSSTSTDHRPLPSGSASSSVPAPVPSGSEYRPSYKVNKKLEVMEKMGLQIKTPDGSMRTAQQLRAAAGDGAQSAPAPYFNAAAGAILDQVQKRKLLWAKKDKNEAEQAAKWSGTRFAGDDGKQVSKFMRLMGVKEPAAINPEPANKEADPIKKQEELFQAMQAQYEVARATTHTMRGVGLGFQRGQF